VGFTNISCETVCPNKKENVQKAGGVHVLIKYSRKEIRQTHLVYLLVIFELVTCFDPAWSSSGLYVNQVMFKTAYIFGIPLMFKKDIYI
jgi:hypothetical protein